MLRLWSRLLCCVVLFGIGIGFLSKASASYIRYSEADMCQARWVFIGTAVGREAYAFEWPPVMTAVTLSVETLVHGDPPPTVVIRFIGGTLNGVTVSPETMMVVGQRYLVVASPIMQPVAGSVLPRDGTVLVDWWSIGDKAEIQSDHIKLIEHSCNHESMFCKGLL